MQVLYWLIIQIIAVIALVAVRLTVAVKKAECRNLNKWVTIGCYSVIIIMLLAFTVSAVVFKEKILYMYVCSFLFILIYNVILGRLIAYLNKHTIDDFK